MLNQIEDDYVIANYEFRSGEILDELRLHYSTLGTPKLDAAGSITNAVLFLHWTGASGADLLAPAFSEELFGAGQALDLTEYFVIVPDNIGHGRSSKPSDGLHARFPRYGFHDMVDLQHRLITLELGIRQLHLILGLSIGGMHAWMWGEQFPELMRALMPVVSLPAPVSGRNLLWRRIVAQSVRTDPTWKGGSYTEQPRGFTTMFPLIQMMLEGVPQLETMISGVPQAEAFVRKSEQAATTKVVAKSVYQSPKGYAFVAFVTGHTAPEHEGSQIPCPVDGCLYRNHIRATHMMAPLTHWKPHLPIDPIGEAGIVRGHPGGGRGSDVDWWFLRGHRNSVQKIGLTNLVVPGILKHAGAARSTWQRNETPEVV